MNKRFSEYFERPIFIARNEAARQIACGGAGVLVQTWMRATVDRGRRTRQRSARRAAGPGYDRGVGQAGGGSEFVA